MSKPNPMCDQVALYFLSIGVIEVDDNGQIWKLKDKRGGPLYKWKTIPPRRMKRVHYNGYIVVDIWLNGKCYGICAHRIVWLFNEGLIPNNLQINHRNGIKQDNKLSNLELMTSSENTKHSYDVLGRYRLKGEEKGNSKLKEQDIRDIRVMYAKGGISQREIGELYGVAQTAVGFIVRRVTWAHVS